MTCHPVPLIVAHGSERFDAVCDCGHRTAKVADRRTARQAHRSHVAAVLLERVMPAAQCDDDYADARDAVLARRRGAL